MPYSHQFWWVGRVLTDLANEHPGVSVPHGMNEPLGDLNSWLSHGVGQEMQVEDILLTFVSFGLACCLILSFYLLE